MNLKETINIHQNPSTIHQHPSTIHQYPLLSIIITMEYA